MWFTDTRGMIFLCRHCSLFRLKASSTKRKELQNPRWVYMTRFEGALVWGFTRGWENDAGGSQDVVSSVQAHPGLGGSRPIQRQNGVWLFFFFFRA